MLNSPSGENRTTLTVLECRFSVERNSTVAALLSFTEEEDLASLISHIYNMTKIYIKLEKNLVFLRGVLKLQDWTADTDGVR